MRLETIDWVILAVSVAVCFVPPFFLARRAGRSVAEFFTSGQSAPWWLIGLSMVATTFSTDTPNLVTDIVRQDGVAGNWVWWAFLLTGMLTVFLFARLWRRSGVLTDLEFYELRYAGRAASAVRGFRAVYLGLFFNCFIMATVNLAAVKIANIAFGWPALQTLLWCGVVNIFFAATAGLWGVLVIDMIQFGIAMSGAIALAVFVLGRPEIGGLAGLVEKVGGMAPLRNEAANPLWFVPDFSQWDVLVVILVMPLLVQWWSVWYPGAEPGGGSYIAQRMLAARSERDALGGTLLFNVAHYALRPWPWILVALATFVIYPLDPPETRAAAQAAIEAAGGPGQVDESVRMAARGLTSLRTAFPDMPEGKMGHDMAYPAMLRFLPPGFLGLMLAGLLAAYVSTMITHLNWGTSYLVHDLYRRFAKPNRAERHYVRVGRWVTGLLMVCAGALTLVLETAKGAFDIILSIGAGTGLIYLLRWFWWRINAWCEIAAMVVSFGIAVTLLVLAKAGLAPSTHVALLLSVAVTTVAWLVVAWLTPPVDEATLVRFCRVVRPPGPGWKRVLTSAGIVPSKNSLPLELLGWGVGSAVVWSALFATGHFLMGRPVQGFVLAAVFVAGAAVLVPLIRRLWSADLPPSPTREGPAAG